MGEIARNAATVDALCSLAEAAARHAYVRPQIAPEGGMEIEEGRHPVLERVQAGFVANDARLSPWQEQVMVITGPNMAGKSTFLRQVALITLMAHAGSFVPARRARIGVVDGIYCRIGATDRLARGQSTFMVEMTEVAQILNHATEKSLLVFDEVGRGTSTYDGISIAWAIIEHVARQIGAMTLFATHYYELTALADRIPSVRNLNVLVREWKGKLVFLYRIAPGRADRSYGVQVARLAGLAEGIVGRARELLRELEKTAAAPGRPANDGQLSLFEPVPDPVRARLEGAQLEEMTPLDALNMLHELRDLLQGGRPDDGNFSNA
jgi:DNA mismatch repair protein MutS